MVIGTEQLSEQVPEQQAAGYWLPVPVLGMPADPGMESSSSIISGELLSNGAGDGTEQKDVTCKSSCQAVFWTAQIWNGSSF